MHQSSSAAINAGIDMIMVPDRLEGIHHQHHRVRSQAGEIPMARIDDAVTRILRVKLRAGCSGRRRKPSGALATPGRGDARRAPRALARQAVRESLVLLKNERGRCRWRARGRDAGGRQERRLVCQPGRRLVADLAGHGQHATPTSPRAIRFSPACARPRATTTSLFAPTAKDVDVEASTR